MNILDVINALHTRERGGMLSGTIYAVAYFGDDDGLFYDTFSGGDAGLFEAQMFAGTQKGSRLFRRTRGKWNTVGQ